MSRGSGRGARRITRLAMFVALVLVTRILPAPPGLGGALHLTGFPVIVSGFVLGPAGGFWVGAVSDLLGFLLRPPAEPFFPGFTLTQALTGAIPAWVAGRRPPRFWLYLGAILIGQGCTSVLLVSWFCHLLYGIPFWAVALKALVAQLAHAPVYAAASVVMVRALSARGGAA